MRTGASGVARAGIGPRHRHTRRGRRSPYFPDDSRLNGTRAIKGDCRSSEILETAGVRDASAVVIVTSDDLVNVTTALLVRKLNPSTRVVVRMFNQNLLDRLGTR